MYDQIRFLNAEGMERIKVTQSPDGPMLVQDKKLQFKGNKYYFTQTIGLQSDEIYISPMDLNMEMGEVEAPYKPVIRFGLPVADHTGHNVGILMINHSVKEMLERFTIVATPSPATTMLLNPQGYWLSHPDSEKRWGFMFETRKNISMRNSNPEIWNRISGQNKGQFVYHDSLISFATVYPFEDFAKLQMVRPSVGVRDYYWKVVSQFPPEEFEKLLVPLRKHVMVMAIVATVMISVVIFLLSLSARRKAIYEDSLRIRERAMETSMSGIMICDARAEDMPVVYCNSAFETLTGFTRDEVLGKGYLSFQIDGLNPLDMEQMGQSFQQEVRSRRKDGSIFWSEMSVSPVFNRHGELSHYIAYVMDISERQQTAAEKEKLLANVQQLSRRLIETRELERSDITRSLHDDIGQMITAIQVQAEYVNARCQVKDCPAAGQGVDQIKATTGDLHSSVRNVLKRFKPGHLDELGLIDAVREMCDEWMRRKSIIIDFSVTGDVGRLTEKLELALFHIIQEALTNIIRHAQAGRAEIRLVIGGEQVELLIEDDGQGFDVKHTRIGIGLAGMRERVNGLMGYFSISSELGRGVALSIQIPISPDKENP